MKQALTFTPPILSSTESKLNVEAFDASVEAFENHEYLKSFMPYWIISTEISGRNTAMYRETNFIFPTVLLS